MASWMQEAMKHLPVGVRFLPTDGELLDHYLRRKTLGFDEPDCAIPEVDLCRWEPEELCTDFIESSVVQSRNLEWWFFSERKPGRTQDRSTRGGYWKVTGPIRNIKSRNGTKQVIGSKKILTFYRGNASNSRKTDWVIHEYLLASNALDDHFGATRKSYAVCMIKCNSYETTNSAPSYQCEQDELKKITDDFADVLEAGPDHGSTPEVRTGQGPDHGSPPEDKIQEITQSQETSYMNNNVNPIQHPMLGQDHSWNSAHSSTMQLPDGVESIGWVSPFCASEDSNSFTDIFNNMHEMRSPTTMPPTYELQGYYDPETQWPYNQEQPFIMENKQTPEVESLHGFVPLDEKKGIIEDDSTESTASSLLAETPESRIKKELPQIVSDVHSEAKALTDAPSKIKEDIISPSSSSTSTHKPREVAKATRFEEYRIAADTTRKKDIDTMAALSHQENTARQLRLVTAEPRSCSLVHSSRRCTCRDTSMTHNQKLLEGILVIIAVYLLLNLLTSEF